MSVPRPDSTLAMRLERHRIEFRLLRIASVVAALRARAQEHEREVGRIPSQLLGAIADFEAEIGAMHERLHALGGQLELVAGGDGVDRRALWGSASHLGGGAS